MKKNFVFAVLLSAGVFAGCEKYAAPQESAASDSDLITFSVADPGTKGIAVVKTENLTSFKVAAVVGSEGNETAEWNNATFTKSQETGKFVGGRNWPSSDHGYRFYASNVEMAAGADGQTVKVTTIDTDVVCAYVGDVTYREEHTLTFEHILSRVGTVDVTSFSTVGATDIKVVLKYRQSGTYNLRTKEWSGLGAIVSKTLSLEDNDLWIIPGKYDCELSFLDRNGLNRSKEIEMEFKPGEVGNISCTYKKPFVIETVTEYGDVTFTLSYTAGDIPAKGGKVGGTTGRYPVVSNVKQTKWETKKYTDGTTEPSAPVDVVWGGDETYSIAYNLQSTGTFSTSCPEISAGNLHKTPKDRISVGTIYVKVTGCGGKSLVKSVDIFQEANVATYGDVVISQYKYDVAGYTGAKVAPVLAYSQSCVWTSGDNDTVTEATSVVFSTVTDHAGATLNTATGEVTWTANDTEAERKETEKVVVTMKGGKSAEKTAVSTQSAASSWGFDTDDKPGEGGEEGKL